MHRDNFLGMVGATVVAIVLLGGPLDAGASSRPAGGGPKQAASGVHGTVNLTIWSIDSDGPDFQAILSGAIGDYGPAVTVFPNGTVDPEHTSDMKLDLRHGTFRLYIDGIVSKFRAKASHEPLYAATCSDYFRVSATVPVAAGSGTGAYRGIRGNLSLVLTGNEDEKSSPCGPPFVRQILLLTGSGSLST